MIDALTLVAAAAVGLASAKHRLSQQRLGRLRFVRDALGPGKAGWTPFRSVHELVRSVLPRATVEAWIDETLVWASWLTLAYTLAVPS